jgi:hypothetical protein
MAGRFRSSEATRLIERAMSGLRGLTITGLLLAVLPTTALGWSDWEAVDRGRLVWMRTETRQGRGQPSLVYYQFRNDNSNSVALACWIRSFDDGRPIDTAIREQLAPGLSDPSRRFVVGDGTMVVECYVD